MIDTPQHQSLESERRSSGRVPVDFPVAMSESTNASVAGGGESVRGRARDLCREAVLVEADHSFPLGTELDVVLEANRPLKLRGRVVRLGPRKPGVMAIAFTDITPENQAPLDALLASPG